MSVSCQVCVLSSRRLCLGLITRLETCSVLSCETSTMRSPRPTRGCRAMKKELYISLYYCNPENGDLSLKRGELMYVNDFRFYKLSALVGVHGRLFH